MYLENCVESPPFMKFFSISAKQLNTVYRIIKIGDANLDL